MITDSIKMGSVKREIFDKKQIALAIKNSTFDDELKCSLIEENVIKDCDSCGLKFICDGIDEVSDKYVENTTKVINSFML